MLKMSKFGDWIKAGVVLQSLSVHLKVWCIAQLSEDGEFALKVITDHIDNQDLPWIPLSPKTIELKGGDDTIYIETGYLRDNLEVRKVKSASDSVTFFIGASPWRKTPSGEKLSDVMIWMEYGTDKMPARPLIRPSWDEIEKTIKNNWKELLGTLVTRAGGVIR